MFGIGLPEMILIMALALIVVGPDKLPDLARSIAKGVLELKKTVSTLKDELDEENPFDSVKPELEEAAKSIRDQLGDPSAEGWQELIETQPEITPYTQQTDSSADLSDESSIEVNTETALNADEQPVQGSSSFTDSAEISSDKPTGAESADKETADRTTKSASGSSATDS